MAYWRSLKVIFYLKGFSSSVEVDIRDLGHFVGNRVSGADLIFVDRSDATYLAALGLSGKIVVLVLKAQHKPEYRRKQILPDLAVDAIIPDDDHYMLEAVRHFASLES